MGAVRVVIGEIVFCESEQVNFVEDENVIQKLAAAASDPTLRYSVLPGGRRSDANRFHAARFQQLGHFAAELAVTIENRVAARTGLRECLSQLLPPGYKGTISTDFEGSRLSLA